MKTPSSPVFLALLILAALCLIGWAAFGQTNEVATNVPAISASAPPAAPYSVPLHWPAFAVLLGWLTHANWDKIILVFKFIQNWCDTRQSGLIPLLFHLLFGWDKTPATPDAPAIQPAATAAQPKV